jgi:hypothetical protein
MISVLMESVALAGERPEDERWRPDTCAEYSDDFAQVPAIWERFIAEKLCCWQDLDRRDSSWMS